MKKFKADLHIHSCLSPCAELDMTPQKIVAEAVKKGLDLIAITDHNSAENIPAFIKTSTEAGLYMVPGMEITTLEEVHIIALFNGPDEIFSFQEIIYKHLQPGENDDELFGLQVVANENDEVEYLNKRLLIGATSLSINKIIDKVHEHDGIAIAAHIDRESYSIISQLGFIPPGQNLDALEVSRKIPLGSVLGKYPEYKNYPFITSSDSHTLESMASVSTPIKMEKADFSELKMAFKGQDGRSIIIE